MTPNQITGACVVLAFVAVMLFGRGVYASLVALTLTVVAITLDALDGYIARHRQMATPLGAQLDILGDRVIENLFFTYSFAYADCYADRFLLDRLGHPVAVNPTWRLRWLSRRRGWPVLDWHTEGDRIAEGAICGES